ncbi:hypothetical protein Aduo_005387 [Ancylostoma duodenale]
MLLALLSFVLLQSSFASTLKDISFNQILKTNQYLLISQHRCQTTFESNVRGATCPRGFANVPREWQIQTSACDYPVGVHLIRDPERKKPPRAMYIGRDRSGKTVAFVEDLELPQPSPLNTTSLMYSRIIDFPNRVHKHLDQQRTEFTIYDQSYQLLYLVARDSRGSQHCTIYRLSNLFPGIHDRSMFVSTYVYEFSPHTMNKARTGWTEDPYSDEVFYATTNGEITSIHVLPLNRLMSALQDGVAGKRVFSYEATQRSFISVSGGVLFSQHHKDNYTTVYIRSFDNYSQQSLGISCGFVSDSRRSRNSFPSVIIVRDWEYCQIRDGAAADRDSCQHERDQWMVQEGLLPAAEPTSWWLTALIVSVIILVTLLFLLILYICWLRRSLDDTFDADQTTNLRYYPGQYPEMDVSVDRWNY